MKYKTVFVWLPVAQNDLVKLLHHTWSCEIHQAESSKIIGLLEVMCIGEFVKAFAIDPHNEPTIRNEFIVGLEILKISTI